MIEIKQMSKLYEGKEAIGHQLKEAVQAISESLIVTEYRLARSLLSLIGKTWLSRLSLLIMFPISFWIILMNEGIRKVKPYRLRLSK
ncbi:hypothetical protein [Peribacillus muralis]|uniref:hypothetical protein n=1 Tax=Peribacillus muralis TaxID=264697 RepID=UPI00070D8AA7|nr:hypothetical protein [Peribacillus muralis]